MFEKHLRRALFERRHRCVRLNRRARACFGQVRRIPADNRVATKRRNGRILAPAATTANPGTVPTIRRAEPCDNPRHVR